MQPPSIQTPERPGCRPAAQSSYFGIAFGLVATLGGCGGGDPKPITSSTGGSAGASTSSVRTSGVGGSAGAPDSDLEIVSVEEARQYSWQECGRIESSTRRSAVFSEFTPDGESLVVAFVDGSIVRFSLDLEQAPSTLREPATPVPTALALSLDGRLAEISEAIVIRDLDDGAPVLTFPESEACLGRRSEFSPSGDRLIVYGDSSEGCILDLDAETLLGTLPAGLTQAAFLDDEIVALGCGEEFGMFCVYDASGVLMEVRQLDLPLGVHGETPVLSPRGDAFAATLYSNEGGAELAPLVYLFDANDGSELWSVQSDTVQGERNLFSADGALLLSLDGVHRIDDGELELAAVERPSSATSLSVDGTLLATSSPALIDLASNSSLRLLRTHGPDFPLTSLDIDAEGRMLVTQTVEVLGFRLADDFEDSVPVWQSPTLGPTLVSVSNDGRFASVSGDIRLVLDPSDGRTLWRDPLLPDLSAYACLGGQLGFSHDGQVMAGKRYATSVDVFDTSDFSLITRLHTAGCGQGIVFSADDGRLHAPEISVDTSPWPLPSEPQYPSADIATSTTTPYVYLAISPLDGTLLKTSCGNQSGCTTSMGNTEITELQSEQAWPRHARFSREGQWVVLGGTLLHLPTRESRVYDENVHEAIFAPNGDIIAGREDATLVRYCRTP